MLRHFTCLLGLVCAIVLAGGCQTSTPLKPKGAVAVTIDRAKKATEAKAQLENLITLTLPPVAAGQVWQITFHDARFLKQMQEIKAPAAPGGGATVVFLAINPTPRTRVRFLLLPNANSRDPIEQQELILEIR